LSLVLSLAPAECPFISEVYIQAVAYCVDQRSAGCTSQAQSRSGRQAAERAPGASAAQQACCARGLVFAKSRSICMNDPIHEHGVASLCYEGGPARSTLLGLPATRQWMCIPGSKAIFWNVVDAAASVEARTIPGIPGRHWCCCCRPRSS
jgi:hypothetical protein